MPLIQTLTNYQLTAGGRIYPPNAIISLTATDYAVLVSGDKGTKWADYTVLDNGTFAPLLTPPTSVTYNSDGTVATQTINGVATTYTYNSDGTVATETRAGVTRTYGYTAGQLTSVA